MLAPVFRQPGARLGLRQREHVPRPALEVALEQRQVEQPLAGVVDDLELQGAVIGDLAAEQAGRREADGEAEAGEGMGRLRPARLWCCQLVARAGKREG